jgi:hypothetical protein
MSLDVARDDSVGMSGSEAEIPPCARHCFCNDGDGHVSYTLTLATDI